MRITLKNNQYRSVSIGHYPSYDERAKDSFITGDIHICGHVHKKWKHCWDLTNAVLNINVGVDVWNYKLISEEELIRYIDKVMNLIKTKQWNKVNRIKILDNKVIKV